MVVRIVGLFFTAFVNGSPQLIIPVCILARVGISSAHGNDDTETESKLRSHPVKLGAGQASSEHSLSALARKGVQGECFQEFRQPRALKISSTYGGSELAVSGCEVCVCVCVTVSLAETSCNCPCLCLCLCGQRANTFCPRPIHISSTPRAVGYPVWDKQRLGETCGAPFRPEGPRVGLVRV